MWYAILYASGTKQCFILFVEHFYFEYDVEVPCYVGRRKFQLHHAEG